MSAQAGRGLTAGEFALVREIVKYRREQMAGGWPRAEFSTNRAWGGFLTWKDGHNVPTRDRRKVVVEVAWHGVDDYPRQLRLTAEERADHMGRREVVAEPKSVTEAVDMLVALGFLPARFSSAYGAGWNARHEAATLACRDGMGKPGMNSAEVRAISPAVER